MRDVGWGLSVGMRPYTSVGEVGEMENAGLEGVGPEMTLTCSTETWGGQCTSWSLQGNQELGLSKCARGTIDGRECV